MNEWQEVSVDCRTSRALIAFCLLCVLGGGCDRKPAASLPPEPPDTEPERVVASADTEVADADSRGQAAPLTVSEPAPESTESPQSDPSEPASEETGGQGPTVDDAPENGPLSTAGQPAGQQADQDDLATVAELPRERFVLLAAGGPLVIDVFLQIGGESFDVALQQLVQKALAAADEDQDGVPRWSEIAGSERFRYGQFGNLEIDSENDRVQLARLYDKDGDDIVDRDEVPRFVTRNVGRAKAFSLESSNEFRRINRVRSPLRQLVDVDRNGAITPDEMTSAPARLLRMDADDDEVLTLREVVDDPMQTTQSMSNQTRLGEANSALLMNADTPWSTFDYALLEVYECDVIESGSWPAVPQLFTSLDTNENQLLDSDELRGFETLSPQLILDVRFGIAEGADSDRPRIELRKLGQNLEKQVIAVHRFPQRVSIELPDTEVEFFVSEDPSLTNPEEFAANQIRRFDFDRNGYLDEEEFPNNLLLGSAPFSIVDSDGDGQLVSAELVAYLSQRQAAFRGQVRARAAHRRDAAFTALDANNDGRLNSREIRQAPQVLQQLDRNQDGRLRSHEIPDSLAVGFVRGNPQSDNALFVLPVSALVDVNDSVPGWFRGMDANGDGEVSELEFIGLASQFREFDSDADGFLSAHEAGQQQ